MNLMIEVINDLYRMRMMEVGHYRRLVEYGIETYVKYRKFGDDATLLDTVKRLLVSQAKLTLHSLEQLKTFDEEEHDSIVTDNKRVIDEMRELLDEEDYE